MGLVARDLPRTLVTLIATVHGSPRASSCDVVWTSRIGSRGGGKRLFGTTPVDVSMNPGFNARDYKDCLLSELVPSLF